MVSHAVEDHILPMTKAALQDEDTLMSPSVLKLLSCILEGWPEAALLVQRYLYNLYFFSNSRSYPGLLQSTL